MKPKQPCPGFDLVRLSGFKSGEQIRIELSNKGLLAEPINYYTTGYAYYYYSFIRAFHISVSRWFFTGIRVTASLLKSSGLFSVFWPFSIMLSFGWSPPIRQLPSPPVPLVILKLLFQTYYYYYYYYFMR